MRVAGHTMGTPDMDLADAFRLFRRAGLDAAEVVWQDGYRAGIPASGGSTDVEEAARLQDELGVKIICLTPYMSEINSLNDREREAGIAAFQKCIRDAERLSCGRIRVYAGSFLAGEEEVYDTKWQRLIESLRFLGPIADAAGVTLCVENHFNTMAATAQQTAALLEDVATKGVGVLYDQANLDFAHQEPYEVALPLLLPWIEHVQVKDFVFTDPDAPFEAAAVETVDSSKRAVQSRPVGDGVMDWKAILGKLHAAGYDGYLSLEYEYRWHPQDLPPPDVGFPRSASVVRSLLAELEGNTP